MKGETRNPDGYLAPYGVTADAVVFTIKDDRLAVLLARRQDAPCRGRWALPGGFIDIERETARNTIMRKLHEKTGLPPIYVEQLRTYDDIRRDKRGRVLSIAHLALIPSSLLPNVDGWHTVSELPPLPFDHGRMIADGVFRLRGKLWYSNIAVGLLPLKFTAREALAVYSVISGRALGRPDNLVRDLRKAQLIEPTGEHSEASHGGGRRPKLYRFVSRDPAWSYNRR